MLKLLLITIIFVSLPLSLFAYTCTDTSQKSITIVNALDYIREMKQ